MSDTIALGTTQPLWNYSNPTPQEDISFADKRSALQVGANLAAEDEGSRSIYDRLTDIPTKFVPLTGAAIFNSFANTAVDAANFFGADFHRFTIEQEFGPDSDTTRYYQNNSGLIEGTAIAIGSLAPGMAGIKALKLAQTGRFGSSFQTATGIFSGIQKSALAEAEAAALGNATGTSLFGQVQGQTIRALAAGVGDNALQGAAYEVATLATMHANPIYDQNTMLDNVKDVASTALLFGAFGGVIDGAKSYYQIRQSVRVGDVATKAYEKFGAKGIGDITSGDRIVALYDELDKLPAANTRLEMMKRQNTENTTQRLIRQQFIEAADGDTDLAAAMHLFVEKGKSDGLLSSQELVNQLGALKKIGRYDGLDVASRSEDVFYINSKIDARDIGIATTDDLFSKSPESLTKSKSYILTDKNFAPSIARESDNIYLGSLRGTDELIPVQKYTKPEEAWKEGNDIFLDRNGTVHVNPKSKTIREVPQPGSIGSIYSGKLDVWHSTWDENFSGFLPVSKVDSGMRFDGDGGVFGSSVAYLDETGSWSRFSNSGDKRWSGPANTYKVEANFRKAFVLTPESAKKLGGTFDNPLTGEQIVSLLRNDGYDGLIVRGWNQAVKDLEKKATAKDYSGQSAFPRGMFPDYEKLWDARWANAPAENARKLAGSPIGSHEASDILALRGGVHPDISQDQVLAFYPEQLITKGLVTPEEGAKLLTPKPINTTDSLAHSRILSEEEKTYYLANGKLPPGASPVFGIGTTLDVHTGKLYRDQAPPAVVGDLGKPKLAGNSILDVGKKTWNFSLGEAFDVAAQNPLDANARYVWAALRGARKNDLVHSSDLPWIEQAYRELKKDPAAFQKLGIETFSDGIAVPKTADEMLSFLAAKKQDLYIDMLEAGKNADEISRILNAPTKGITKNFNNLTPEELMFSPESSTGIRHVRLAYDIGTTRNDEGNLLQGMMGVNYRMKMAEDANNVAFSNWLGQSLAKVDPSGKLGERYLHALKLGTDGTGADILGAGGGFFRNANAEYGSLAQQVERSGKAVGELQQLNRKVLADQLLGPINKIRTNPAIGAEWGNLQAVAHSTGEHWSLPSAEQLAEWGLPKNTLVLENAVTLDKLNNRFSWNPDYIPSGFSKGTILQDGQTTAVHGPAVATKQGVSLQTLYTISDDLANLLRTHRDIVNERNGFRQNWWNAQGLSKPSYPAERVYFPPINANRYPYFAYVTSREGYALGESGASIITAKSAAELQQKIAALGPEFDAFTKGDIANFKKAQNQFEWDRNFMSNQAKTEMARKGILNNIIPETRTQNLIDELVSWHFRQSDMLLRDHVELYNSATFAQLVAMGDRWAQTGTTRFGAVTPFVEKTAKNPYNSYIRTALNISQKDDYPLWQLAQDKLDAYADRAFNAARNAFGAAKKGLLPFEEAAKVSERFGLGNPYGTAIDELAKAGYQGGIVNQLPDSSIFRKFVGTSNTILGATTVRLDAFQQIIDAATFPILSSLEYLSATPKLKALTAVTVPGSNQEVPGFARVFYNAIRNFFKDEGTLAELYTKSAGLSRDELRTYRSMIDDLTLPLGPLSKDGWAQKIDNATHKAEGLVGTKFTNRFLHFLSADIGRQLGEAAGQSGTELLDTIGTFTNRVLGTSAANQRAAIFTGPVGQALGLFQSFNWNVMQQLLRNVGEGNTKAVAIAAGLQSTIFGVSTLPGFAMVNRLIAERHGNEEGADIYSGVTGMLGRGVSDYLLYGSLSGLLGTSFYDRGDMNPRRLTLLPVNPLEFPSVAAGMRVYQNLAQLGQNLTQPGASATNSLLFAAEHNGLSRPLSGLIQLAQGYSTDNAGRLISSNSGFSDMYNIANLSRVFGAKPLDEAISADALRRIQAVQVKDQARLGDLGRSAMTSLYAGNDPGPAAVDSLLSSYVKAGGSQENFSGWFMDKIRNANTSVANQMMDHFNNPRSRTLQRLLGGVPLPDYRVPITSTSTTE